MTEYTPDDARMKQEYLEAISDRGFEDLYEAEYDRWLEEHDREIRKRFADELTRKGIYSFNIHQIRQYASE